MPQGGFMDKNVTAFILAIVGLALIITSVRLMHVQQKLRRNNQVDYNQIRRDDDEVIKVKPFSVTGYWPPRTCKNQCIKECELMDLQNDS